MTFGRLKRWCLDTGHHKWVVQKNTRLETQFDWKQQSRWHRYFLYRDIQSARTRLEVSHCCFNAVEKYLIVHKKDWVEVTCTALKDSFDWARRARVELKWSERYICTLSIYLSITHERRQTRRIPWAWLLNSSKDNSERARNFPRRNLGDFVAPIGCRFLMYV